MDSLGMTEENYRDLLDMIAGRGKWAFIGGAGFHTWPTADEQNKRNHAVLCEMERRGMVRRVTDEPDHCCFVASEKDDG